MERALNSILAENVRYYRKYNKLTQFELSEKMNCSPAYIGFIENAKSNVSFETIDSLCVALNITPKTLFQTKETNKFQYGLAGVLGEISAVLNKYL